MEERENRRFILMKLHSIYFAQDVIFAVAQHFSTVRTDCRHKKVTKILLTSQFSSGEIKQDHFSNTRTI